MFMNFQDVILKLNQFWAKKGCVITQPYDLEVGAGGLRVGGYVEPAAALAIVRGDRGRPG